MLISAARAPAKISHEMPRPTSFGKDTGLQVRMAVTLFLLGLVYVVLVVTMLAVGVNGVARGRSSPAASPR